MRSWMIFAALLVGLATQAQTGAPHTDQGTHPTERQHRTAGNTQQDKEQDDRRPQPAEPASTPATPSTAQPVFVISCNPSGCNDNQGNFLTRSGPQRLVGPKGISCQLMGGNWQCSPATQP